MEPIRPDEDELRAERSDHGSERAAPVDKKPPRKAKGGGGKSGNGRSGSPVLWVLVIALAGASAAGWYSHKQQIAALEGQLEEADEWVRQSKLALARFEGDLSETGDSLEERGASLREQLEAQQEQLDEADSEIRKLWAVANERNKKRLNEQEERISAAESALAENEKALADVGASVEKARSSLSADVAALSEQTEASVANLEDANREASEQLTRLSKQVEEFDQLVDRRVRRFEQEQKLGISDMEARLSALEKKVSNVAGSDRTQALRNELAEVKRNVETISSSRSQFTSRLVRLSEEVNQLRSQLAGR